MSTADAPVQPGEVIAGKYKVERVLGVGGMGVVVAATHLDLDERVAIKFLLKEAAENRENVIRFMREAKAATKIKSEHVCRVLDVGKLPTGAPYMVMEHLQGCDLSDLLQKHGQLPVELAVDYLLQASEALAQAHTLGIIHRDLKPSNLFLVQRADGSDLVKVLDFGISKMTGASAPQNASTTTTSAIMGTPYYMSPEQLTSSKSVDPRSDVWALGAVLFELLTGRPPFVAATMPELVAHILAEPAPRLDAFRAGAPPALCAVVARCLEKSPDARFPNVGQLAMSLTPFATTGARTHAERASRITDIGGPTPSMATPPRAQPQPPSTGASWGQGTHPDKPAPRRGRLLLAVGGATAVVGALGAVFLMRVSAETPVAAQVPPSAPAAPAASAAPPVEASAAPQASVTPPAASGSSRPMHADARQAGKQDKTSTQPDKTPPQPDKAKGPPEKQPAVTDKLPPPPPPTTGGGLPTDRN